MPLFQLLPGDRPQEDNRQSWFDRSVLSLCSVTSPVCLVPPERWEIWHFKNPLLSYYAAAFIETTFFAVAGLIFHQPFATDGDTTAS